MVGLSLIKLHMKRVISYNCCANCCDRACLVLSAFLSPNWKARWYCVPGQTRPIHRSFTNGLIPSCAFSLQQITTTTTHESVDNYKHKIQAHKLAEPIKLSTQHLNVKQQQLNSTFINLDLKINSPPLDILVSIRSSRN